MCPLITKLLKPVSVISLSTAICEENFSTLTFNKNKTRIEIGNDILDYSMLVYLEKGLGNKFYEIKTK